MTIGGHPPRISSGDDWRKTVAELLPSAASRPPSAHTAQLLASRGRYAAAIAVYRELIDQHDRDPGTLRQLASLLKRMGESAAAADYRRQAVQMEVERLDLPDDVQRDALRYMLAADGLEREPACTPSNYVALHFDRYADHFDAYLTDELQYRGPQAIFDAIASVRGNQSASMAILDVGCGSGLAGPLMRPLAHRLDGVDLSAGMIAKARERDVYDHLQVGEMVEALALSHCSYDLVIAVDVLVYVGNLEEVFRASYHALTDGGMFAFTVEAASEGDFYLSANHRYAHHADYVDDLAQRAGFAISFAAQTVIRLERGEPVQSLIRVLQKTPG